jgi:hypothetical protein
MAEEFLGANSIIKDPIIIDPPGETPEDGWKDCADWVERKGGMVHPDGEPNIAAAFGADQQQSNEKTQIIGKHALIMLVENKT